MLNFLYEQYDTYDALTEKLEKLAKKYPGLAKLSSIAATPQGRQLWLMTVTDYAVGEAEQKPAYYIDGNFHAGEVTGSMAALYTIDYLLSEFAVSAHVQRLLRQTVFYILPRVSPDGAEVYLTTPASLRSVPRLYPEAEQLPGLAPADINGDGEILLMRQKSRYGDWKISGKDSRLMERRLPDEEDGEFYRVYPEGLLQRPDECEAEPQIAPAKWGLDLNRSFPCNWDVEAKQAGAGPYPLAAPEARAVADFILQHKNIGYVSTLHTTGGAFLRLPGIKPEKQAPKLDIEIFQAIGEMAAAETGYANINVYSEFFSDPALVLSGAFDDWLYCNQGIPAHTIELWDLAKRAGVKNIYPHKEKNEEELAEDNLKILQWNDRELQGTGFVNWSKFQHPQLGEVEIGGFKPKIVLQNCPVRFLAAECEKVCRFMLRNANTLPHLTAEAIRTEQIGAKLWRVSLLVGNDGYLPTNLTEEAIKLKTAQEVTATLSGAVFIEGLVQKKIGHLAGRAGRTGRFLQGGYRSGPDAASQKQVSWLLRANLGETVVITLQSAAAGKLVLPVLLAEKQETD